MFWNGISADRRWTLDFYGIKDEEDEGEVSDEFIDDLDPEMCPCPSIEPPRNAAESEKRKDLRMLPPGHALRQELFGGGISHCWLPIDGITKPTLKGGGQSVSDPSDVRITIGNLLNGDNPDKEYAHGRLASAWFHNQTMQDKMAGFIHLLLAGKKTKPRVDQFVNVILFAIDNQPKK